MRAIPTFLRKNTLPLLNVFAFGCLGRRRGKHKPDPAADIEDGASHNEKNDTTFLYDPAIEKPVIIPMEDCPDDFVEISLANGGDVKVTTGVAHLSKGQATKARTESPVAEVTPQKPARAKLLDILAQFPLPPAYKESETAVQQPVTPASNGPKLLRKSSKKEQVVERISVDMDVIDLHASPVPVPLSPVSTRRSSLVWFADKSNYCDDLSTDSANYWVSIQRVGPNQNAEWITDWRDDMATVLEGLHEVHKQEEEEDFRDIFANASLSSGYSLPRSSGSLSGHAMRWSGKWNT